MAEYTLTITNKVGFSCYTTINVDEVVELGESYNIIAGGTEIYLPKDNTLRGDNYLYYRDGGVEVYLEYILAV